MSEIENKYGEDHPRVCGEQELRLIFCFTYIGSPPRVRGTEQLSWANAGHVRITPACAGNSSIVSKPKQYSKDHPRVCGEQ